MQCHGALTKIFVFVQVDDHFTDLLYKLDFDTCMASHYVCVCVCHTFLLWNAISMMILMSSTYVHVESASVHGKVKGSWYLHSWGAWAINSYAQTHFGNEIAHLGLLLCLANDFLLYLWTYNSTWVASPSGNRLGGVELLGNQWETWTSQPRLLLLPASLGWADTHLSACVQVSLH